MVPEPIPSFFYTRLGRHHEQLSRCALRFLFRHLLMFFNDTDDLKEKSVFQRSDGGGGLLSLKSGAALHLYMNQLPKGSAQIPSNL